MKKITFLTLFLSLFMANTFIAQNTYYVSAAGNNGNDGLTLATAKSLLNVVVNNDVASGDTIIIDGAAGPIVQAAVVNISVDLTIIGQNNAIVDGSSNVNRIMAVSGGVAVNISGVTFSDRTNATIAGAVINLIGGSTLNIDDCAFINNSTSNSGGAIFINASTCNVTNSLFKGNSSSRGGAIYAVASGKTLKISNSTFYDNIASTRGGAIYVGQNTLGTFEAINVTIAKNSVQGSNILDGGGIKIEGTLDASNFKNCLIYDNTYNNAGTSEPSDLISTSTNIKPTIENSIIGGTNGPTANSGLVTNSVVNLTSLTLDYTDIAAGTDEVVKYADATYPVNYGDATLLSVSTDQKGMARETADGKIDAGAWASGFTNEVVLSVTSNELASLLTMYYNSSSKTIEIKNSFSEAISINVFNILGSKVLSLANINDKGFLNASTIKPGMYLLQAKSSTGVSITKKFIVN